MPITYIIDPEHRFIVETWTGGVGREDLRNHWRVFLADPEVLGIRRTLVDLRAATIHFTGQEMDALISAVVLPKLEGRAWKTAIVVDCPVQFGVSRQYQAFAERYSTDSIFSDPESAVAWLLTEV